MRDSWEVRGCGGAPPAAPLLRSVALLRRALCHSHCHDRSRRADGCRCDSLAAHAPARPRRRCHACCPRSGSASAGALPRLRRRVRRSLAPPSAPWRWRWWSDAAARSGAAAARRPESATSLARRGLPRSTRRQRAPRTVTWGALAALSARPWPAHAAWWRLRGATGYTAMRRAARCRHCGGVGHLAATCVRRARSTANHHSVSRLHESMAGGRYAARTLWIRMASTPLRCTSQTPAPAAGTTRPRWRGTRSETRTHCLRCRGTAPSPSSTGHAARRCRPTMA